MSARQWLTLEHAYLAPTFDGDSIWNVFATGAYRDLRAVYEVGLGRRGEGLRARVRAVLHRRRAAPAGGSMGATWRRGRGLLRADGYWDDGYGGRKVGVDASARLGDRGARSSSRGG